MEYTEDWELYQQGIDYKMKLNLYNTVNRNERFYAGHHWDGVDTAGLPQVKLNVTKRIINWKVAQVMSEMLSMQFSCDSAANHDPNDPENQNRIAQLQKVAALLTDYAKTTWERLKEDSINEQGLIDACLSGDAVSYFYWDDTIDAGGGVMGDMAEELIDNVNYYPGNTSDPRPNDKMKPLQPYIILAFRKHTEDVRKEAERNGASEVELQEITCDSDVSYQAGDMAQKEANGDKSGKCTVLLKLWPKTERVPRTDAGGLPVVDPVTGETVTTEVTTIWARKSTRSVVVRPDWNTKLHRYPVAVMNWQPRKNSCHGEPEANELIPNNVAINKLMATMILWTMLNAYPKVIYDNNRIDGWNNDITKAIPVNGEISGAAQYLQPQGLPASVMNLFELLVATTKDMAGSNETALGDNSITRTASGIIALQKASILPLSMNKRRYSQWVEDKGLIWLDFWLTHYGTQRLLTVEREGQTVQVPFDGSQYNKTAFSLKIDVGASNQWSEVASIQTLDNLLGQKLISFRQYLERIYNGLIPQKQELIDELAQQDVTRQNTEILYQLMAMYVDSLPPELQAQLEAIRKENPGQYEMQVKQMIMGGGGVGGVPGVPVAADGGGQQV